MFSLWVIMITVCVLANGFFIIRTGMLGLRLPTKVATSMVNLILGIPTDSSVLVEVSLWVE